MTMRGFNEMMKVYNVIEFVSSIEGMLILTLIIGTLLYAASNIRVKISNRVWFFKTKVKLVLSHMVYEEPEILKNVIQFAETQINGTATVVLRDKHDRLNTFYVVVTTNHIRCCVPTLKDTRHLKLKNAISNGERSKICW